MKKLLIIACGVAMVACLAFSAQANYVFNPGFEINSGVGSLPSGWLLWIERGSTIVGSELGSVGTPAEIWVAGVHGPNLNGGIYQYVPVPVNETLYLDGFWSSHPTAAGSQWGEVIVFDGFFAPTNGVDINPPSNGNKADGELIYKNDTWTSGAGWSGKISLTSPVKNIGTNIGTSTTGVITLILKSGNIGGDQGTDFDNITLVPEPSSIVALAGGLVAMAGMLRRKS